MKIIFNKSRLVEILKNENNLGFVPTMGNLHKGHKSLIRKSIDQNYKTIVSIFVNKPQFNRKVDFKRYPKTLNDDIRLLKKLKVNFLFLPSEKQMYPKGINKKIRLANLSKRLCGKFRPGHFEAVADVIDRFIKIIKPKKIYFGEKDMQQLLLMDDFIKHKHKSTKVVGCKTIREKNGTAYSSRNLLLTKQQKKIASKIYKILKKNKNNLMKKKVLMKSIRNKIINTGIKKIDYLEILNINNLISPKKRKIKKKIFISYYLGVVRLIDNI